MTTLNTRLEKLERRIKNKEPSGGYCQCPEGNIIVIESVHPDGTKERPSESLIAEAEKAIWKEAGERCPICGKVLKTGKRAGFITVTAEGVQYGD